MVWLDGHKFLQQLELDLQSAYYLIMDSRERLIDSLAGCCMTVEN